MVPENNQTPDHQSNAGLPPEPRRPATVGKMGKLGKISLSGLIGLTILIGLTFAGGTVRTTFHWSLPGPVIALGLLAAIFLLAARFNKFSHGYLTLHVAPISRVLINHMGLLFIPAGVGIISLGDTLRKEWLPTVAALAGSTLIGLSAGGWLMQRFAAKSPTAK